MPAVKIIRTKVLKIGYHESGDPGFPVILLHGFPADAHAYDGVTAAQRVSAYGNLGDVAAGLRAGFLDQAGLRPRKTRPPRVKHAALQTNRTTRPLRCGFMGPFCDRILALRRKCQLPTPAELDTIITSLKKEIQLLPETTKKSFNTYQEIIEFFTLERDFW